MGMKSIAAVILAAGNSSRLGVCKQLIQWHGRSLLSHTVSTVKMLVDDVVVVTGAFHHRVEQESSLLKVDHIYNQNWSDGVHTSISLGLKREFNVDKCLLVNVDQPLIPFVHYKALKNLANLYPNAIVATNTSNGIRLPIIVPHKQFYAMTQLKNESSLQDLFENSSHLIKTIDCEDALFDIDTPFDMSQLKQIS